MAYTTIAQVRVHILNAAPIHTEAVEQLLTLSGTDWHPFYAGPVASASITVASRLTDSLTRLTVNLIDGSVLLPNPPLQAESLVVASDSSLGRTYLANRDYHIDYRTGRITRKADGSLTASQMITVWYRSEHQYVRDLDFQIDSARGRLRRLSNGAIADGETVLLRYEPSYGAFPDDVIEQATAQANRLIEATVDATKEFGADPVLSQAATYAALAIVCRTAASRDLAIGTGLDRSATAWLQLAESYQKQSQELLAVFRPPAVRPNPPRHTSGGI